MQIVRKSTFNINDLTSQQMGWLRHGCTRSLISGAIASEEERVFFVNLRNVIEQLIAEPKQS